MSEPKQRRTTGVESRRAILEAATEVAAARGFEGTSISAVSERSGLPASSIYWHFEDKDALIASVIDASFERWLAAVDFTAGDLHAPTRDRVRGLAVAVAKSLLESPDFLRLGLLLTLERPPGGSKALDHFLEARRIARTRLRVAFGTVFPALASASLDRLTTYAMAGADGLFVERETLGDAVDLLGLFELHATGILAVAEGLAGGQS